MLNTSFEGIVGKGVTIAEMQINFKEEGVPLTCSQAWQIQLLLDFWKRYPDVREIRQSNSISPS